MSRNFIKVLCLLVSVTCLVSSTKGQTTCSSPPPAPSLTATAGPGHRTITITASLPREANSVTVYYTGSNGVGLGYLFSFDRTRPNSFVWTGLDTNQTYYFRAFANNSCGSSAPSQASATTLDIDPPTISATPGPDHRQITVSTSVPPGAFHTLVKMSEDGVNFGNIKIVSPNGETSFTFGGFTYKTYYFYVEAEAAGGRKRQSGVVSATTFDIDAPSISAVGGPGYKEITVSANIPPGADRTEILGRSDDGTSFRTLHSIDRNSPSTSFTWRAYAGLDTNKTYYFKAVTTAQAANRADRRVKESGITSATTRDINAPSLSITRLDETRALLTWNVVEGADRYEVYAFSTAQNKWNGLATVGQVQDESTVSYIVNNLGGSQTFYYHVKALSGSRVRESNTVSISTHKDQNAGKPNPCDAVGKPINVTNGNMYLQQTDYNLPGVGESINVNRFYNSLIQGSGWFGFGWSTQYDENIAAQDNYSLRLGLADGRAVYFARTDITAPFTPSTPDFYGQVVKNADNTFTLTFKDGRVHQFNAAGRLTSLKDLDGNQTTLAYNASNQLIKIIDPFARVLTVTPNAAGYIGQISDSIGTIATYAYNPNGTLLSVTYPDNSKYKFEYITVGSQILLTTVKDALDNILETHQYDSLGRATTSEVHGGVEKYTLDYSNLTAVAGYTQVTDALGRVTKYYVDKSRGRNVVTKIEGNCNCGSGSQVTNYEYDSKLNLIKQTDALGHETTYTYDANGNRLTMTDVLGTQTFTYNSFGQTLTSTDRMNGTTTNTFDAKGNLLTTRNALGKTTTFTYTPLGQLSTVKDARNNTTTLAYDAVGRLSTVRDAALHITTYGYDARARVTSVKNALNQTTTYAYDLNNRLKKVTFPDAKYISYAYDLAGRRTTMTDARGKVTTYGYDSAYRLTSVKDPLNHTTTFGYDSMSNRTSVKNALNQVTNYEFDSFDRLQKIIYPPAVSGGVRLAESLEYDPVGNVKKRTDTAGRNTLYEYDQANRLQQTTDADLKTTQFEYNNRSQMTAVVDALNQRYTFSYDSLGRVLSQTRAGTTMSYQYDAVGNRTKRTTYSGTVTTYTYDALNRLKTINYPVTTENVTLGYDALSRLTAATNQNGTVSFSYDTRGRIASTTDVWGKVLTYGYDSNGNRSNLTLDGASYASYVYDSANRLTGLTNVEDGAQITFGYDNADKLINRTYPNGVSTNYKYDGMSRLTGLKDTTSTATLFDRQYSYNSANQIAQLTELTNTKTFSYDNLDRLTNVTASNLVNENYQFDAVGNRTASHLSGSYSYQAVNRLTAAAGKTFTYNANGNMLTRQDSSGTWTYSWDYENRLKKAAKTNGINIVYKYDALGRRVERVPSVGVATKFTSDGQDVLLDQNSDGTTVKYLNGQGIDNKLRQTVGSNVEYFLSDHLGSTNALVNAAGAITSQTNYDAFGNQTATVATRYGYTGRERDDTTGLMYYRARQYSPELGRFISEDPIGFAGGDVNLYGYVGNNPILYNDPSGKAIPLAVILGKVAIGAGSNMAWNLLEQSLSECKFDPWAFAGSGIAGGISGGLGGFSPKWIPEGIGKGIGLGGFSDFVGQGAGNWLTGKDVTDGLWENALGGAIAGSIGGSLKMDELPEVPKYDYYEAMLDGILALKGDGFATGVALVRKEPECNKCNNSGENKNIPLLNMGQALVDSHLAIHGLPPAFGRW